MIKPYTPLRCGCRRNVNERGELDWSSPSRTMQGRISSASMHWPRCIGPTDGHCPSHCNCILIGVPHGLMDDDD